MHDHSTSSRRVRRAGAATLFALLAPAALSAQSIGPGGLISPANVCDFDIPDHLGRFVTGSVVHLVGRPGASSNRGDFILINGNSPDQDVDKDGYQVGPQCDYTDLFLPPALQSPLVNVQNPSQAIPSANVILINFPRTLPNGTEARTEIYVEIPAGTPAGRYIGKIQVRDRIKFVNAVAGTNEVLGLDQLFIDVEVTEELAFQLVNADSARRLDSLIIRGRSGQRASGVLRVANIGNSPLSNVRLSSTDLRSESAVGLVIPAEQVLFSTPTFSSLALTDTARITVTAQIPRGFLGGRYRGTLIVQAENATRREIPLVIVVTSNRGILFGNNPVRAVNGDLGQIAFNGDPGTAYKLGIFDMAGLMVFEANGTVFAGVGTAPNVIGADFAVNVIWPLVNGRGEPVASGMYLIIVESFVNGQRQLAQDKLIVIR